MPQKPEPPEAGASTGGGQFDHLPLRRIEMLAINQLILTVPSTIAGRPEPAVPLDMLELRLILTRNRTPRQVTDRAWRYIGAHAREHQGEWNLFALGTASPGLTEKAGKLGEDKSRAQKQQVHFALAVEFLLALHRLDLDKPNVWSRLLGAAYDQASGRKRRRDPVLVDIDTVPATEVHKAIALQQPEAQPRGDPRQVLDRLVHQTRAAPDGQRLTELQATLIARTRLDGEKLKDVAAELGISQANASKQRTRAEAVIARHLGRPDLAEPPKPRSAATEP